LVVGAGLLSVAYPFWINNMGSLLSVVVWWIVTLPWSFILLMSDSIWPFLKSVDDLVVLMVLLHAGFVALNFYLLYRFAHPKGNGRNLE